MTTDDLYKALFRPGTVAIVGASDSPEKTTGRPLDYLTRSGWPGTVYPVNPTRSTVLGHTAYPSVRDLPTVPDQVFVLVGADDAIDITRECAELGVTVVTILADGFVETDPAGVRRIAAIREIARNSRTRILGPSSLGLVNLAERFLLTANAAFAEADLPRGGVFVASQSGSAIGALVSRGKGMGIGFHGLVATGSELDLSLGEICLSTVGDPGISSYALFLENLHAADDLRRFACAAAVAGKPIVAYKLGRSEEGAGLSVSHTGALAGDDAVATALLHDLGIARVTNFEALLEAQQFARLVRPTGRGNPRPRVAVISTTGGGGAMVVDCLAVAGAVPTAPSPETVARLAERGVDTGHGVLIDLTLAGTRYEVMKAALDVVCSAPEFDAVVAVPGSSARFRPDLAVKPIADSIGAAKPLAAFIMPDAPEALTLLREAGVAAFRTPEACAEAVVAVFDRRAPKSDPVPRLPDDGVSEVLDEVRSYDLLSSVGVPHAGYEVIDTTLAGTGRISLPVPAPAVVKVLSAHVPHKSDIGGVVLGIADDQALDAAIKEISTAVSHHMPEIRVDRVLVQEMVKGLGETLIGYRYDADAGPIVVLAAGGVLAEMYQDRSVRTAPVDLDTARDMVGEVVSLRALTGYRGAPRGDLDALAAAVVAMSRLGEASGGTVVEAEANPVMVLPEGRGVVAVDALVRIMNPKVGR
ncbi:acetate--CoA ligase family protein [Nocardia sp. NPDC005366]|uniref:acetate--CoA ligase family protein n=1 Tax=Nocardia sp. NPDC005366 TaxID=3156878 RepID=UPI0033AC73F3